MLRKKLIVLSLLLVVLALVVAACGAGGSGSGQSGGAGGDVNFNTAGSDDFKFNPNTLAARAGQKVNVTLKNNGALEHTFTLTEANFEIKANGGQTSSGTFTAPAAGTYTFFCSVAGHKEAGMVGTLTVQ